MRIEGLHVRHESCALQHPAVPVAELLLAASYVAGGTQELACGPASTHAVLIMGLSIFCYMSVLLLVCSLFGEDVQLLLDMDRVNSPNSIQVSDAALALISTRSGQFTPVFKVNCNGREIQMHAWMPEVSVARPAGHALACNGSSITCAGGRVCCSACALVDWAQAWMPWAGCHQMAQ